MLATGWKYRIFFSANVKIYTKHTYQTLVSMMKKNPIFSEKCFNDKCMFANWFSFIHISLHMNRGGIMR